MKEKKKVLKLRMMQRMINKMEILELKQKLQFLDNKIKNRDKRKHRELCKSIQGIFHYILNFRIQSFYFTRRR